METEHKSGDVVGIISEETAKTFLKLEQRRMEAWAELERVNTEEINVFEQLGRDLGLTNEYRYTIKIVSGEVVVKRRKTESEIASEEGWRKTLRGE